MDRFKIISIIINVVLIIIIIIGVTLHFNYPDIKIIKEKETETVYVNVPVTIDDYKACYLSPLSINGVIENNWLIVTAKDSCKIKTKSFQIAAKDELKNILIFSPVIGFSVSRQQLIYGGSIQYFYRLFHNISIGGGFEILAGDSKIQDITIKPGIAFHF